MKISVISFTRAGAKLGRTLCEFLRGKGHCAVDCCMGQFAEELDVVCVKGALTDWTKTQSEEADGLVFIGAVGIAVRAIAGVVKDKRTDPAVVAVDDKGQFVIPLLSGHIGGANELACEMAAFLRAVPIITTSTDIHNKFAVDVFAKKNKLYIGNMEYAKFISAAMLEDKTIGFCSEFQVEGTMPRHLCNCEQGKYGIKITLEETKTPYDRTLCLIPPILTLGIGCRKGKTEEEIKRVVEEVLREEGLSMHGVEKVASIDLKKHEKGLLAYCATWNLPFVTYTVEELEQAAGEYGESAYVKSVTGIGNVCQRAAVLGSDNGIVLKEKYAKNGVTVSVAKREWSVIF